MFIVYSLLVFGFLIFVHELGHFTFAKLAGIKVHAFALGMGPALFKLKKGETEYSLRLFPIGGYVKMEGEDEESTDERGFNNKPIFSRILVIIAGALMNIVVAFLIYCILSIGVKEYYTTRVDTVVPEQTAGIVSGDEIVKMGDYNVKVYGDIQYFMFRNEGKDFDLTVKRNGEYRVIPITPIKTEDRYLVGFSALVEDFNPNVLNVIAYGYRQAEFMSRVTITSLIDLFTGRLKLTILSGPVGITNEIGKSIEEIKSESPSNQTNKTIIIYLLEIAGAISINLGVLNLLPLPALDGGRLLFLIIEGIRRKPLKAEAYIHTVGFFLLMALAVIVVFFDVGRIFGGG